MLFEQGEGVSLSLGAEAFADALAEVFGLGRDVAVAGSLAPNVRLVLVDSVPHVLKFHSPLAAGRQAELEPVYRRVVEAGLGPQFQPTVSGALLGAWRGWMISLQRKGERGGGALVPEMLGQGLGRLHATLEGLWPDRVENHLTRTVPDVPRAAAEHGLQNLVPQLERVQEAMAHGVMIPLHGDLHPGNILVRSEGVPWFLDFDSARSGPAFSDLAFACFRFYGPGAEGRRALEDMLKGYEQTREVPDHPSSMLDGFVVFLLARRILFILEKARCGDDSFMYDLSKLQGLLASVRSFSSI